MKQLLLSELGGYPFTQERLADMQSAYKEGLEGILAQGRYSESQGYIISGMVATQVGDNLVISDGLFYYRGKIVRFQESSYDTTIAPGGGSAVMIVITQETTNLQMHSGATLADAIYEDVATVGITSNAVTDDKFLYANIKPWSYGFGINAVGPQLNHTYTNAILDCNVQVIMLYRMNYLNNSIRCTIQVTSYSAQNLSAASTLITLGRLPAAFRAGGANYQTFILSATAGTVNVRDSSGSQYIDMAHGYINEGYFKIYLRKPEIGVTEIQYWGQFELPMVQ